MVLACHVVGNEVDDHLHTCFMGPLHQGFKFSHTMRHLIGQVRINIVIILDGIGRTSLTFHHGPMIALDTVGCIVCLGGMFNHSCVPHVGDSHLFDFGECQWRKSGKLAHSILLDGAVRYLWFLQIAEPTGKYLVNNHLVFLFYSVAHIFSFLILLNNTAFV